MGIIAASRLRAKSFPVTDRLKGCNSLITTKSELALAFGVNESDIENLNFDNVNNQITWHFISPISTATIFSQAILSTPYRSSLADIVEEYESYTEFIGMDFSFSDSNIRYLKLYNVKTIERFSNISKCEIFECPSLESFEDLNGFSSETNVEILLEVPNLTSFGNIGRSRLKFNFSNNIVNVFDVPRGWFFQDFIPYAGTVQYESTIRDNNPFSDLRVLTDGLASNSIITINDQNVFRNSPLVPSFSFPNLENVTGSFNRFGQDNDSCIYYNLKSLQILNNSNSGIFLNAATNGIIDVNIALQDYEGTGVHYGITALLNRGWTVNWYNNDGTLNSTTP